MASGYEQTIWNFLMSKIENEYGVAGLMGNLYAESGLYPNNLQNTYESSLGYTDESYTNAVDNGTYTESQFVNDSAGYGLAQWTYYSRKQGLYDLFKNGSYSSISSITLQLNYLYSELTSNYPSVLSTLETATSVRQASDSVLHDFESPADQSESVEEIRESYSMEYYNAYSGTTGDGGESGGSSTTLSIHKGFNFLIFQRNRRAKLWTRRNFLNRLR